MPKHPTNKNLTIIKSTTFRNLPLGRPQYKGSFEFIEEYLDTNLKVMDNALQTHARTLAVRVDLHLPKQESGNSSFNNFQEASVTRFIKSLKSKIGNHIARTRRNGNSTHRSGVQYIWTCEQGVTGEDHYHLVLFFNNDTFRHPGVKRTGQEPSKLISMIIGAWGSALKVDSDTAWNLVTIPPGASYLLGNTFKHDDTYCLLFQRLSYFAKVKSKVYKENRNSYGSSRLRRQR